MIFAPSCARRTATPWPMPWLLPVTRAIFPWRRFMVFFCWEWEAPSANLFDGYWHAGGNHAGEFKCVPIGKADASVARRPANGLRGAGAVDADADLVQTTPEHADGIARSGRELVEIRATPSVVEHCLVPAELRHGVDADDLPDAGRRREGLGAGRDREGG